MKKILLKIFLILLLKDNFCLTKISLKNKKKSLITLGTTVLYVLINSIFNKINIDKMNIDKMNIDKMNKDEENKNNKKIFFEKLKNDFKGIITRQYLLYQIDEFNLINYLYLDKEKEKEIYNFAIKFVYNKQETKESEFYSEKEEEDKVYIFDEPKSIIKEDDHSCEEEFSIKNNTGIEIYKKLKEINNDDKVKFKFNFLEMMKWLKEEIDSKEFTISQENEIKEEIDSKEFTISQENEIKENEKIITYHYLHKINMNIIKIFQELNNVEYELKETKKTYDKDKALKELYKIYFPEGNKKIELNKFKFKFIHLIIPFWIK